MFVKIPIFVLQKYMCLYMTITVHVRTVLEQTTFLLYTKNKLLGSAGPMFDVLRKVDE
jgi:hypothetical protein